MRVELIYDADCPNVAATRSLLIQAFMQCRVPARWREWERSNPHAPPHVKAYGSPTILVDGKDVAGVEPSTAQASCRLYRSQNGQLARIPSLEMVRRALSAGPAEAERA